MVFNDPAFGPNGAASAARQREQRRDDHATPFTPPVFRDLPVTFNNVLVEKRVDTWGVEANYLHRFMTSHTGGTFEMFLGARYFEFNDNFCQTSVDPNSLNQPAFVATQRHRER